LKTAKKSCGFDAVLKTALFRAVPITTWQIRKLEHQSTAIRSYDATSCTVKVLWQSVAEAHSSSETAEILEQYQFPYMILYARFQYHF